MAVSVTHGTAADGTFSASGATAWNETHTVTGLGDSAEKNVGTTAGTVAAGDHLHAGVYEPAGTASTAVSNHEAAADPHPVYLTAAEGGAAYEAKNANIQAHIGSVANPHSVTKSQVGLANVDNTSDANKPVSTATQTALDGKQTLDADLTAIAALSGTGYAERTGANTWQLSTPPGGSTQVLGNGNTANVPANAADTYLTGSSLAVGGKLKAGTIIRWRLSMTKTAAGTATPVYSVRFGTNGTTADTARCTFTGPAQTAATDTGWHEITVVVRSVSATGTVQGVCTMEHHNTTTGLQNVAQIRVFQSTSAAFDNSGASLIVGLSCNPGASGVWTFQLISAEAVNLV